MSEQKSYLPDGLAAPAALPDGLDTPYWEGIAGGELRVQRCRSCQTFQWGPEWICHSCLSFDVSFEPITPRGVIYSWERVWHPVHPALKEAGPYIVVLVELPDAGRVRMVGNLLGDPGQEVEIGAPVEAVFEKHGGENPHVLVQWRVA